MTGGDVKATGAVTATAGYNRRVYRYDPMTGNLSYSKGMEFILVNPDNDSHQINYVSQQAYFAAGMVSMVSNISSTYTVYLYGPNSYVGPGESVIMTYDADYPGTWRILFNGQTSLRKVSGVTFASVTTTGGISATSGRVNAKIINGAVSALTNSSTISCDMNTGNVFTLSTTTAVGNVQINATNGVAGQRATFIITDDATGGHVVTFGTNFKSNGTLTGTASKTATVDFVYNGTNWYEVSRTTGL
jgi:hypothetical protein